MKKRFWQVTAHLNKQFFLFSLLLFSVTAFSQAITGPVPHAVNVTSCRALTHKAGKFSINAQGRQAFISLTARGNYWPS
jgi:hypothetical protein